MIYVQFYLIYVLIFNCSSTIISVSYTHLDVYKRQVEEKSSCHPAILGILGLLALAGLITAIVLAAKASNGYGSASTTTSQAPGVPTGNITTPFVPITPVVPVGPNTSTVVQPVYSDPISVNPQTIAI